MSSTKSVVEKYGDIVRNFRLLDDDFLNACLEGSNECVEYILKILLKKDLKVMETHSQVQITNLQGRDIRLDVKAVDDENRVYNIEVQRDNGGAGAKRARRNGSLLDATVSDPGQYGENLPETWIIFITEHDCWHENEPLYRFDRVAKLASGKDLPFGDDLHILYVNAAYKGELEPEVRQLMADFKCTSSDDMSQSPLRDRVSLIKNTEQGVVTMCQAVEKVYFDAKAEGIAEGKAEGKAEGIAEGKAESNRETAVRLLAMGLSVEQIAQATSLTVEEVEELKKSA